MSQVILEKARKVEGVSPCALTFCATHRRPGEALDHRSAKILFREPGPWDGAVDAAGNWGSVWNGAKLRRVLEDQRFCRPYRASSPST